jgi:Arc/MetJ-type ribon-helix-helix transcriptional regulator
MQVLRKRSNSALANATSPSVREYDNCMKRITVSLPDELVDEIKRAAGGDRQVSAYVATALEDYQERERLDEILAAWRDETPVPEEIQQQVEAELDQVGLTGSARPSGRMTG